MDGNFSPGAYTPSAMSLRSWSAICRYTGRPGPRSISCIMRFLSGWRSYNHTIPSTWLTESINHVDSSTANATEDTSVHRKHPWGPVFQAHPHTKHKTRHDGPDRKSTRLNSSHVTISYAVSC